MNLQLTRRAKLKRKARELNVPSIVRTDDVLNVLQVGRRLVVEREGAEVYATFSDAYNMHPYLHPSVWWDGLFALRRASKEVESPLDVYDLAIQRVALYKREQDK